MDEVIVEWREEPGWLSRQVDEEIGRIAGRLRQLGATRVVLFGARGTSHRYSDVDLIAVMPDPPPGTFPQRLKAIYKAVAAQALATGIELPGGTGDEHDHSGTT